MHDAEGRPATLHPPPPLALAFGLDVTGRAVPAMRAAGRLAADVAETGVSPPSCARLALGICRRPYLWWDRGDHDNFSLMTATNLVIFILGATLILWLVPTRH